VLSSRSVTILCVTALLAACAAPVQASFIIYGSHCDYEVIDGASLTDVRLGVDLFVSDSLATLTFTNMSSGAETSVVFKQIVIDTMDDDSDEAVLWDGIVLTDTADVSYTLEPYITLPGFNPVITDGASMVRLEAAPAPVRKGIAPGESVQAQFATSLPDGSAINDYFAFFEGGDDTGLYSIGMHAISAAVVDGESLSGAATEPPAPEPATVALLAVGAWPVLRRRRQGT